MRLDVLKALNAARRERRAGAHRDSLSPTASSASWRRTLSAPIRSPTELETALRMGKSGAVTVAASEYFLTVHAPSARLVLVGAVHISQALAPMARIVGLDVTIIDPRTAFATPERFPGDAGRSRNGRTRRWPQRRSTASPRSASSPTIRRSTIRRLTAALEGECFYIGALGSRKTHAKRVERMRAEGFGDAALARIHAPIGLDIGAVSPAEIAASIIGEIVAAMRKKPLRAESGAAA